MQDIQGFKDSFDLIEHVSNMCDHKEIRRGIMAKCPFHDDCNPSMLVTQDRWYCFACGVGGDSIDFLIRTGQYRSIKDVLGDSPCLAQKKAKRAKTKRRSSVKIRRELVDFQHNTLVSSLGKISYFVDRGITQESIDKYMLGYGKPWSYIKWKARYAIPTFDINGNVATIKYRIDKDTGDTGDKYLSHPGASLYPYNIDSVIKNKSVVICGGQLDAIVLEQNGIPSASPPAEGVFRKEWASFFTGKTVYILLDNDNAGRMGTDKIAKLIPWAHKVYWPRGVKKKYDVNDAILDKEFGIDGIKELLSNVGKSEKALAGWGDE